jgi:hypothetical protein
VRTGWVVGKRKQARKVKKVRGSRSVVSVLCDCGQLKGQGWAGRRGRQLCARWNDLQRHLSGIVGQTTRCIVN